MAAPVTGTVTGWGATANIRQLHSTTPLTNGVTLAQRNCLVLTDKGLVAGLNVPARADLTNLSFCG